jgi:D-glycero-D-manno-heptose 1,7-bisphosphate phosphatase
MALDDLLVCYHDTEDDCNCRKPRPGLLLEAAERLGIDLSSSYMVGDRWKDVACGAAVGCITVFVDYGYAETFRGPAPIYITASAADALDRVLSMERSRQGTLQSSNISTFSGGERCTLAEADLLRGTPHEADR